MRFSRQDIKNFDGPIGDPFGGPAANKLTGQKYQEPVSATIAISLLLVSAYGSYEAGQDKKKMYEMQSKQAEIESGRRAVQYEIQANQILQRTNSALASTVARGYAGGTQGFEGSAALVQQITQTRGGKEFMFALDNADMTRRGGLIQASLYEQAGSTAARTGTYEAIGKVGQAFGAYASIGGAPGGTSTTDIMSGSSGTGGFTPTSGNSFVV
jgi:hypothetical protein